jgi:hypothetical protein
VADI